MQRNGVVLGHEVRKTGTGKIRMWEAAIRNEGGVPESCLERDTATSPLKLPVPTQRWITPSRLSTHPFLLTHLKCVQIAAEATKCKESWGSLEPQE